MTDDVEVTLATVLALTRERDELESQIENWRHNCHELLAELEAGDRLANAVDELLDCISGPDTEWTHRALDAYRKARNECYS